MASQAQARVVTQKDRDDAVNRLAASYQMLLDAVSGLTAEQWNFKSAPDQWSIAECVEHIATTEGGLLALHQRMMAAPVDATKSAACTDAQLSEKANDRSNKFNAPERFHPSSRWSDPMEALKHLKEIRDQGIAQASGATDDLRTRFAPHPVFGELDAFQWICLRGGHTERHTLQIKAIQSNPAFPK